MVHLEWTVDFLLNFGTLVLSTDSPPQKKNSWYLGKSVSVEDSNIY